MSTPTAIFWRLRHLRKANKMTLEDLSNKTGLTKSYLSKLERGASVPSIASALKLAQAYGLAVGDLIGENSSSKITVVRRADRKPFETSSGASGSRHEAIISMLGEGILEAFMVHPPMKSSEAIKESPSEHRGQELVFIVRGRVEISWPTETAILNVGDVASFDARLPHKTRSLGAREAEMLVVVASTQEHPE